MKKYSIPSVLVLIGMAIIAMSFVISSPSKGELELDIVKTETIMSAAHNVYGNEEALDGKYYLFKAKITNQTNQTLEDVTVRYRIPGYID